MLNNIIISMHKSEWTNTIILYLISQQMTMVALTVSEILNGIKGSMPTIFNLHFKFYFVGHFFAVVGYGEVTEEIYINDCVLFYMTMVQLWILLVYNMKRVQERFRLMSVFYFIWQWYNCGYCWCILWRGYRRDLGWWVGSLLYDNGTTVETAGVYYEEGIGEI